MAQFLLVNKNKKLKTFFARYLAIFTLVFSSCSKNSYDIPFEEQEHPEMIITNGTYVLGKGNMNDLVLKASTISVYSGQSIPRTELQEVSFNVGELLWGNCEQVCVSDNNNKASLVGSVIINGNNDEQTFVIKTDSIYWDNETGELFTEDNVLLWYDNGTEIEAIGMVAYPEENLYEFKTLVKGTVEKL